MEQINREEITKTSKYSLNQHKRNHHNLFFGKAVVKINISLLKLKKNHMELT